MNATTAIFQVTRKCPYHCSQCYMQRANVSVSVEVAQKTIDLLVENGAKAIQWIGREPMAHPDMQALIVYARQKGLYNFGLPLVITILLTCINR